MAADRSEIPRRLPRGSHGLDRKLVAASQRERLLEAVGRAVADRGYGGATIDEIVRRAGVSKMTFYEHFRDKEECFVEAYGAASEELLERVRAAYSRPHDWLERTRAGVREYLRWLAGDPALAPAFLIEVAAAGPRAAACRERLRDRYAELLRELQEEARSGLPSLPRLPDEIFHALVAAVDDLVVRRIREAGAENLPELEPIILHLEVALLAGPEMAAESAAL